MADTTLARCGYVASPTNGLSVTSVGSELFVLNKNSKTAQTGASADPYDVASNIEGFGLDPDQTVLSTPTAGATPGNVRIVPVPENCQYLDLYHLYAGTADPTSALAVQAFGWVPNRRLNEAPPPNRQLPYDESSATWDNLDGYWIPLDNPVTGELVQTFNNTYALVSANTTGTPARKTFRMSPRKTVYLTGVKFVMVLVTAAANQAGAGLVVGRFVS